MTPTRFDQLRLTAVVAATAGLALSASMALADEPTPTPVPAAPASAPSEQARPLFIITLNSGEILKGPLTGAADADPVILEHPVFGRMSLAKALVKSIAPEPPTPQMCIRDWWKAMGANVVGISCDSPFVLKAWAEKEGFKHTLLSDQHRRVCKGLGIYWADMNTTQRGTVIVGRNETGTGKVKFIQTRQPGNAMKWEEVVAVIS